MRRGLQGRRASRARRRAARREAWLGRVVNAMGEPIDGKGPLPPGRRLIRFRAEPPPAHARSRVGEPLDLGVRVLNTFTTCCRGQRMGIFAGSGVGKSVLLSMLARNATADVAVIGLVGERGREVQEFLQEDLGEEGLARSVVVVATSDEPALMRRQAAYLTLALAEYFRDQGTRGAVHDGQRHALRHGAARDRARGRRAADDQGLYADRLHRIAAAAGARRARARGRAPSPGLFTVLVDGDDHNEPVADAVRGILDGHIVMERAIAERGRYPAVNVLKSVSRTMPRSCDPEISGPRCWRPAGHGDLFGHGGTDQAGRLRAGIVAGSGRRHPIATPVRRIPRAKVRKKQPR